MPQEALLRLTTAMREEAARAPFAIDEDVYRAAGKDPLEPVACWGDLAARIAFLGRDLGKDEVRAGQPLIGPAGTQVRAGVARAIRGLDPGSPADRDRAAACVLLANTVPYKPPGNKAYAPAVKARFRPYVAALLGALWSGRTAIALGSDAFEWFAPYASDPAAFAAFWADEERRYRETITVVVEGSWEGRSYSREIDVAPLPHPSPLNARWFKAFPALLDARLSQGL